MENLAREAVIKSLGVVKLPAVENLPTVFFCGEMHVLPTTLRSTAGCSDPVTTRLLILGTNHTLFFSFYINWAVLHNKPTCSGWLRTHSGMGRGLVSKGKITNVSNQFLPEVFKIVPVWALELFKIGVCLPLFTEQNIEIDNSQVNKVEKNFFPPSQTLSLDVMRSQDLI